MAPSIHRSRAALALAGVLLLSAGSGFSQPQKGTAGGPMVDALSRLTPAQRTDYLQGLRSMEESRSAERLKQLEQAQGCLGKAASPAAVSTCWKTFMTESQKSRTEQAQQQQALAQRFGLPEGGKKKQQ